MPNGASTSSPRPASTTAASSASPHALTTAVDMAAHAYQRDGKLSGPRHRAPRSRPPDGRAADLRPHHPGRPSRHGKDRARDQHRLSTSPSTGTAKSQPDGRIDTVDGGIVGFFSLEMSAEQLATRIISEQTEIPSYQIRRGEIDRVRFRPHRRSRARNGDDPALHRRDRRTVDRPARRPRAPPQAPARARPAGRSTISSCSRARRGDRTRTACRRSPRSPPA